MENPKSEIPNRKSAPTRRKHTVTPKVLAASHAKLAKSQCRPQRHPVPAHAQAAGRRGGCRPSCWRGRSGGGYGRGGEGCKTKPECILESTGSEIMRLSPFRVRRDASSGIRFSCPLRFRYRINDVRKGHRLVQMRRAKPNEPNRLNTLCVNKIAHGGTKRTQVVYQPLYQSLTAILTRIWKESVWIAPVPIADSG